MTLRLIDLESPLEDVEFPDGSVHQPIPFGATEYRLWRDLQKETDAETRGQMCFKILKACYPTATDENFESCGTGKMMIALIAHAARKIDQVRDALKNGGGDETGEAGTAAPRSPKPPATPSSPKTSGATSSRSTRKRSGKTGVASTTASPTDDQSVSGSLTTISTTPNASTRFAESSTTSTAPS